MNTPHTTLSTLHTAHSLLFTLSPLLFALALLLSSCADTLDDALTPGTPTGSGPALTFQLPDRPAYGVPTTRTVPGAPTTPEPWQEGDQLLLLLSLTPYDGNATDHGNATGTYRIYTTLTCHSSWTLTADGTLASYTPAGATAPGPILPLAQLPLLVTADDGTVSLNLPLEVVSGAYTDIGATLYYAPALQWQTENATDAAGTPLTDAAGNALQALRPLRQCAKPGTLPGTAEYWEAKIISQQLPRQDAAFTLDLSKAQFLPVGSRLRVYTGQPGDKVTLLCPRFLPSAGEPNATDYTYTATTDAQGNACFYGTTALASTPDVPLTLDGSGPADGSDTDRRFIVSGHLALIPGLEETDATLFTASASVRVSMTTGIDASQAIDASLSLSIAQNKDFVILDATQFDAFTDVGRDALKAALTTATAKGKTVWQISGLAVESSDNPYAVNQRISAIREALQAVYQADNATRITLYLPDATKLGNDAFEGCNALARASLPLLETAESNTFRDCTSLTSVSLPKLETAGYRTFNRCENLTSATLPKLTTAGSGTFNGCTNLTSVSLPKLTTAGGDTFNGCTNLTSVSLPKLTTAGGGTFNGCTNLTSVSLPKLETAEGYTFYNCTNLTSATLPLLATAGGYTFSSCTNLTSASLPLLATAGGYTFYNCTKLTSVTFGTPLTAWGSYVFLSVTTTNLTLTLSPEQKIFTCDSGGSAGVLTETPFDWDAAGKDFGGYTFKEIKPYVAPTAPE